MRISDWSSDVCSSDLDEPSNSHHCKRLKSRRAHPKRRLQCAVDRRVRFLAKQFDKAAVIEAHGVVPVGRDLINFTRQAAEGGEQPHRPPRETRNRKVRALRNAADGCRQGSAVGVPKAFELHTLEGPPAVLHRSEEHTSELQSL